jgi:hypothetical protein
MTNVPADDRSERMHYRRSGRSGLKLPPISPSGGTSAPRLRSSAAARSSGAPSTSG